MSEQFTAAAFAAQLHTTFRIHYGPDHVLATELTEVDERTPTPRQERFTIVLRGPCEPVLPQGLYPIEHDAMGTLELFLGPFEVDETGAYYAAVFNFRRPVNRSPGVSSP